MISYSATIQFSLLAPAQPATAHSEEREAIKVWQDQTATGQHNGPVSAVNAAMNLLGSHLEPGQRLIIEVVEP